MSKLYKNLLASLILKQNIRQQIVRRTLINDVNRATHYQFPTPMITTPLCNKYFTRFKSTKKKTYDSDDEGGNFDDDVSLSKDSKVIKFNTTSMRADMILKSALGVGRNKIEQIFYESKIRINGRKILKKSVSVQPDDELDVIKSVSPNNPDHLYVARVKVLDVTAKEDTIVVTVRRFKNFLIENYEEDPYKGNANQNI